MGRLGSRLESWPWTPPSDDWGPRPSTHFPEPRSQLRDRYIVPTRLLTPVDYNYLLVKPWPYPDTTGCYVIATKFMLLWPCFAALAVVEGGM